MSLTNLLFDCLDGRRDATPVFESQSALARAIKELERSPLAQRPETSLRSLVNQVLNGHRPMSDDLRSAILGAAKAKLSRFPGTESLAEEIQEAVLRFEARSAPRDVLLSAEQIWDELLKAGDSAYLHYVVTFEPAEIKKSEKAERLRNNLVDNLRLSEILAMLKDPGPTTGTKPLPRPQCLYRFHLPDVTAHIFWARLLGYLCNAKRWDRGTAIEVLCRTESEGDHARLQVFAVPDYLTSLPCVVFDPDGSSSSGFVLFYHGDNGVSPARMSDEALNHWYQNVYRHLEDPTQQVFTKKRITFASILPPVDERLGP